MNREYILHKGKMLYDTIKTEMQGVHVLIPRIQDKVANRFDPKLPLVQRCNHGKAGDIIDVEYKIKK